MVNIGESNNFDQHKRKISQRKIYTNKNGGFINRPNP